MGKNTEANIRMVFNENYLPKGFILDEIKYRKDSGILNEAGKLDYVPDEYYHCIISYKGKRFPVTIKNDEDIKEYMEKRIKENKIEL